jgi:hypothetical protein
MWVRKNEEKKKKKKNVKKTKMCLKKGMDKSIT